MKKRILSSRQAPGHYCDLYYPLTASTEPVGNKKLKASEVVDLLSVIQELKGLEVSVKAEDGFIVFTVGDAEYQIPATAAENIL